LAAITGAILAAPLVYATKQAIAFEGAMADVAKVANVDKKSRLFQNLNNDALKLSEYLATNNTDVGKLYSTLISGGTAVNQLGHVARIAGEAAVAFNMSQESAANAFSTIRNSMGLTVSEAKKAFDATNFMSNKYGGDASALLEYMAQGGASVARTLKVAAPEMLAFGRGLTMSGISASEAGTVMNRFRVGLYKNAEAMQLFQRAGGGSAGLMAVFEAANKSGDAFKWFQQHRFGEYASQMSLLAGNSKSLALMLGDVRKQTNYVGSATQEFNSRMDTAGMKLQQAKVAFNNAATKAGQALLPVLTKFITQLTPLITNLSNWISKNPELTGTILKVVAGMAAFSFATSGVSFLVSGVSRTLTVGSKTLEFFTDSTKRATYTTQFWNVVTKAQAAGLWIMNTAQKAAAISMNFLGGVMRVVNLLFVSSPIGWIALAIGAAAFVVIKNWDKVKVFFTSLWTNVKSVFWKVVGWVKEWGFIFISPIGWIIKAFQSLPDKFKTAGRNIVLSIWEGIKSMASKPIEAIKNIVQRIRNFLPFSPAKEGALRDIHRIRLVETIADSMKPGPMVRAMRVTTAAAMLAATPSRAMVKPGGGSSGGSTIKYSPTITINGSASPETVKDISKELEKHSNHIYKLVKEQERKQSRLKL